MVAIDWFCNFRVLFGMDPDSTTGTPPSPAKTLDKITTETIMTRWANLQTCAWRDFLKIEG